MSTGSDGHALKAGGLLIIGVGTGTAIIEMGSGALSRTLAQAMKEVIRREGLHFLFVCEVSGGLFLRHCSPIFCVLGLHPQRNPLLA